MDDSYGIQYDKLNSLPSTPERRSSSKKPPMSPPPPDPHPYTEAFGHDPSIPPLIPPGPSMAPSRNNAKEIGDRIDGLGMSDGELNRLVKEPINKERSYGELNRLVKEPINKERSNGKNIRPSKKNKPSKKTYLTSHGRIKGRKSRGGKTYKRGKKSTKTRKVVRKVKRRHKKQYNL